MHSIFYNGEREAQCASKMFDSFHSHSFEFQNHKLHIAKDVELERSSEKNGTKITFNWKPDTVLICGKCGKECRYDIGNAKKSLALLYLLSHFLDEPCEDGDVKEESLLGIKIRKGFK